MDIYFVRHGETYANARHRYQPPQEPLSDKGVRDVAKLVRTVQELQPTHLYTSTYARARETASYLSYATELEAVWHEHVHELEYPDYMIGKRHFSLLTIVYGLSWFVGLPFIARMRGAESRHDFFVRIKTAQGFLAANHEEDAVVVVVSHSFFINGFLMHLCRDTPTKLWQAMPYSLRVLKTKNTGITHVRYNSSAAENTCAWEVVSYDQGMHLSED
jgi:broad specificity phosphatase PhoE